MRVCMSTCACVFACVWFFCASMCVYLVNVLLVIFYMSLSLHVKIVAMLEICNMKIYFEPARRKNSGGGEDKILQSGLASCIPVVLKLLPHIEEYERG